MMYNISNSSACHSSSQKMPIQQLQEHLLNALFVSEDLGDEFMSYLIKVAILELSKRP